jgi:vitamin B12/bleomycin/antimicrobial peptide transport system ATP-binding/permease protein
MEQKSPDAWKRFFHVLRLFFTSEVGRPAIHWSIFLLVVILTINGLNVVNSYVGRDFMTAISDRRPSQYVIYAFLYAGVFAASTVAAVFSRFSEERLRLLWREWATRALIDGYLSNHTYFRLTRREEIDNPDQRITEDVRSYTQTMLSFFLLFLNATITSFAFLGVLWSITPWLVLVAVVYAGLGSIATILLGRRLVRLDNLQLKREADLRFELMQVRESSMTIAVTGAEEAVQSRLRDRLAALVANNKIIIAVTRNLGLLINGYNYLIPFIPLLIVAPLYMRGQFEFGVVTQSSMAFAQVLGAFSLIITQFETISALAAVTERLNMIVEAVERPSLPLSTAIELTEGDGCIAFEQLSLWTPKQYRTLVRNLSLSLSHGENLFVTGPNATAKDALFLAAAGLWEEGRGRIVRPGRDQIHFVPARPFAARGSLREQLLIRGSKSEFDDDALIAALCQVGLEPVLKPIGGLDVKHDWASFLSVGDQHLLALARLLLARPRFAFLDRADEGLGPEQIVRFYQLLAESSITYISLVEKRGLRDGHARILELHEDGGWRIIPPRMRPPSEFLDFAGET